VKLIVKNHAPKRITDVECMEYVLRVTKKGKISKDGTQYCYVVAFDEIPFLSRTVPNEKIVVSSERTKTGTFTFQVYVR
jgi:3-hydroxymyristoyl/3-hydroxydecanoyl-(acyl carrier protein) dehydratase